MSQYNEFEKGFLLFEHAIGWETWRGNSSHSVCTVSFAFINHILFMFLAQMKLLRMLFFSLQSSVFLPALRRFAIRRELPFGTLTQWLFHGMKYGITEFIEQWKCLGYRGELVPENNTKAVFYRMHDVNGTERSPSFNTVGAVIAQKPQSSEWFHPPRSNRKY